MGTHAVIVVSNEDKQVALYRHYDGYISGEGERLLQDLEALPLFTPAELVTELLSDYYPGETCGEGVGYPRPVHELAGVLPPRNGVEDGTELIPFLDKWTANFAYRVEWLPYNANGTFRIEAWECRYLDAGGRYLKELFSATASGNDPNEVIDKWRDFVELEHTEVEKRLMARGLIQSPNEYDPADDGFVKRHKVNWSALRKDEKGPADDLPPKVDIEVPEPMVEGVR